mgnify:CR=1 FL=1
MIKLSKAIKEYIKVRKLSAQIDVGKIQAKWEKIVGKKISKNIIITDIKNKKIFVKCSNSVWKHEAQYLKQEILEKIQKETKNKEIEEIIIQ